ncbi:hypothetical protein B9Z55_028133 [Caenorhabditis nigoni]|uniref:Uncharacterized protein n=1 Tax=Caenorhabditis nigoni TaxID=1611254 RepID=A0A2G5SDC0_9PELO|nr:hypothetical protein B9Z55_028133 [Caenorhabditis nigoni]
MLANDKKSVLSSTNQDYEHFPNSANISFSELNEHSLPDLERYITIAVVHNALDLDICQKQVKKINVEGAD